MTRSMELWVPRWNDSKGNTKRTVGDTPGATHSGGEITKYGYLAKRKRPAPSLPCGPSKPSSKNTSSSKSKEKQRVGGADYGSQFGSWLRDVWRTHFFTVSGAYATYYDKPPFLDVERGSAGSDGAAMPAGLPIACIDLRTIQLDVQCGETIVLRSLISGDGLVLRADGVEEAQDWVRAFSAGGARLHISQQRPSTADHDATRQRQPDSTGVGDSGTSVAAAPSHSRSRRKSLDPTVARRRSTRKASALAKPPSRDSQDSQTLPTKPKRLSVLGRRQSLPRALADVRRANSILHNLELEHGGERLRLRSDSLSHVYIHAHAKETHAPSQRPKDFLRSLRSSSLRSRNALSLPLSGLRGRSPVSPLHDDTQAAHQVCEAVPRSDAALAAQQCGALVVLSFNILAQSFVDNPRLANIYEHCDGQWLEWKHRVPLIIEHIGSISPDVLCLQEVDYEAYHNDLVPQLDKLGYDGMLQTKDKKNGVRIAGNATFWKVGQVELVWYEHKYRALVCGFQLVSPYLTQPSSPRVIDKAATGNTKQPSGTAHRLAAGLKSKLSSSFNSLSSAVSKDNATNSPNDTTTPPAPPQFALANVHLEGSPWKHKDRVSQLRSAEKSFVTRKANCRIICGDFNAGADNVLCNILEMAGYISAYPTAHKDATCLLMPHDPNAFNPAASCVDHIYFAGEPLKLHAVTSVFEQDWERDAMVRSGLPQKRWPSDHLSIGALISVDAVRAMKSPLPRTALFHDMSSVAKRSALIRQTKARIPPKANGTASQDLQHVDLAQALRESPLSESEQADWLAILNADITSAPNDAGRAAITTNCDDKGETNNVCQGSQHAGNEQVARIPTENTQTGAVEGKSTTKPKQSKRNKKEDGATKTSQTKSPEEIKALREWSARKKAYIKALSPEKREFVEWYVAESRRKKKAANNARNNKASQEQRTAELL